MCYHYTKPAPYERCKKIHLNQFICKHTCLSTMVHNKVQYRTILIILPRPPDSHRRLDVYWMKGTESNRKLNKRRIRTQMHFYIWKLLWKYLSNNQIKSFTEKKWTTSLHTTTYYLSLLLSTKTLPLPIICWLIFKSINCDKWHEDSVVVTAVWNAKMNEKVVRCKIKTNDAQQYCALAQYNCVSLWLLTVGTSVLFLLFFLCFVLFNFVQCLCNVFDLIVGK